MGPSYSVPNDTQTPNYWRNITLIPREAAQEKEKRNLKLQPEKVKKKEKRRIKSRKKMINTPSTRGE